VFFYRYQFAGYEGAAIFSKERRYHKWQKSISSPPFDEEINRVLKQFNGKRMELFLFLTDHVRAIVW